MRVLAPALVVTFDLIGCAGRVPQEQVFELFPRALNPQHPDHGTIFAAPDGSCFVNLPFVEAPTSGGVPHPTKAVPCPSGMDHPSWRECAGEVIRASEDGDDCVCEVGGNPPPPTVPRITCPR